MRYCVSKTEACEKKGLIKTATLQLSDIYSIAQQKHSKKTGTVTVWSNIFTLSKTNHNSWGDSPSQEKASTDTQKENASPISQEKPRTRHALRIKAIPYTSGGFQNHSSSEKYSSLQNLQRPFRWPWVLM